MITATILSALALVASVVIVAIVAVTLGLAVWLLKLAVRKETHVAE